ncbi:MAG: hypothetical protein MN733_14870 [Nitrososphaera sp.]|nr:hypothetical protein [Nitrososphaera sp.]
MILDFILATFEKLFTSTYEWLNQNFVANLLAFAKGFEFAIIVMAAIVFVLISVYITIRQVRKLPRSYVLEVVDLDGRKITVDGLRQRFSTYDAAESYARFYRKMYDDQYKFRVVGRNEEFEKIVEKR